VLILKELGALIGVGHSVRFRKLLRCGPARDTKPGAPPGGCPGNVGDGEVAGWAGACVREAEERGVREGVGVGPEPDELG
jgi:hypothetical protein